MKDYKYRITPSKIIFRKGRASMKKQVLDLLDQLEVTDDFQFHASEVISGKKLVVINTNETFRQVIDKVKEIIDKNL
ncbi:MAG TPA: hypothetical protein VF974_04965 [Patescibacteria group bacterium]